MRLIAIALLRSAGRVGEAYRDARAVSVLWSQ